MNPIIILLRNELRIEDNPLFIYAASTSKAIIPIWINSNLAGAATKVWLKASLQELKTQLKKIKIDLIIREGSLLEEIDQLIKETKADEIIWSQRFEPNQIKEDQELEDFIKTKLKYQTFNCFTLFNPASIRNKSGGVFKVFTPYYKHCLTLIESQVLNQHAKQLSDNQDYKSYDYSKLKTIEVDKLDFKLNNHSNWQNKILKHWTPGSEGAAKELHRFIKTAVSEYPEKRDIPSVSGTSKLAPYLHFGEISPCRIWHEISKTKKTAGREAYLRQLIWREFAVYILYHFPKSSKENLDQKFNRFPWQDNHALLKAWQQGLTGYPIVDAGMRELWETGWMHNRVRMVVGSFLVKDLLIHWQEGAEWFLETLFDADLANNSMGWQWVAGSGVDASPFFRIFNPTLQGEKFDKQGDYVKKWCPELSQLDSKWIHKPYEAPELILQAAGIKLGKDYPHPIVNHREARDRALEALKALKQ